MKNSVGYLLAKRAFLHPDKEALADGTKNVRLTYDRLNRETNRTAHALAGLGVKKGDRVALLLLNGAEYIELFFALAKLGAICVPLNVRLAPDELAYMLKDSGATVLVYGPEFPKMAAALRAKGTDAGSIAHWVQIDGGDGTDSFAVSYETLRAAAHDSEPDLAGFEDDALFIMYTSGTTGLPKGAVQTHNSVLWAAITMAATAELRKDDRFFIPLPLFHVGALMPAIMSIYFGNAIVTMRAFDPMECRRIMEAEKVTNTLMVPTVLLVMLQVFAKAPADLSSLRWVLVAGAPVPLSLLQACDAQNLHVEQLYGLTEACGPGCVLMSADVARKVGSAGKPFLFSEARVVDPDGKDCAPGVPGELIIKGRNVMREYWNLPEATAETLRDGWLHTGDVATMDDEGFFYIVDRIKDMIISGGENIYPAEVEKVLAGLPGVSQVAVIGKSDEKWGEVPTAIIVRSAEGIDEEGVIAYCEGKLARYKTPKTVLFVDELPLTPTGKVQKRILRERMADKL
jgi:O-succinylbenzoate-CoA ligase